MTWGQLPTRNLKKALAKAAAQTQVNLRKAMRGLPEQLSGREQVPLTTDTPNPFRNPAW